MKYRAKYLNGEKVYEEEDGNVILDKREVTADAGYYVMGDIQPYKSQLTGEMVESRSRHRSLLKAHGCIEVGNETKYLKPKPLTTAPGRKQRLIDVFNSKI